MWLDLHSGFYFPVHAVPDTSAYLSTRSTFFPFVGAPLQESQSFNSGTLSCFGFLCFRDAPGMSSTDILYAIVHTQHNYRADKCFSK